MTWEELFEFLNQHHGADWWNDQVNVYDLKEGEFFPADLVEFPGGDDIINAVNLFLSIRGEDNE